MGILQRLKKPKRPTCGVVIVAAGSASRMEGIDKTMALLGDKPVLYHTIAKFTACKLVDQVVVVTREDLVEQVEAWQKLPQLAKLTAVVKGGADRAESVLLGLSNVEKSMDLVAVHDGARPLVSQEIIEKTIQKAAETGAAAPAIPVKDTLKMVEQDTVHSTLNRDKLRAVQTPQVFDRELLIGALYKVKTENLTVTDDCSAVEQIGMKVHLIPGSEENLKITTPLDLKIAKIVLEGTGEL